MSCWYYKVLFVGTLLSLFWTAGAVSGFQGQWSALLALNGGVDITHSARFTYGAVPADLLVASMVTKPFSSTYLRTDIGGARNWDPH